MDDLSVYFSGEKLYGDDFTYQQIKEWYQDEENGYADLGAKDKSDYKYAYHALNELLGYKYLKNKNFENALGFGSAYGDELFPVINKIKHVTIIDPSDAFVNDHVHGVPCRYEKPSIDGKLPFEDNKFDLITCFGVLHHIPNVTFVINEMRRCLSDNGYMLLREPITSMGDWRKPRSGLTKRERGIPATIFEKVITDAGLVIVSKNYCAFPVIYKILSKMNVSPFNSKAAVVADKLASMLFSWNRKYHATTFLEKLRPTAIFYVLKK